MLQFIDIGQPLG